MATKVLNLDQRKQVDTPLLRITLQEKEYCITHIPVPVITRFEKYFTNKQVPEATSEDIEEVVSIIATLISKQQHADEVAITGDYLLWYMDYEVAANLVTEFCTLISNIIEENKE